MLTPRPSDTAHCARLVTRSLVRFGRRPVARGGVRFSSAHRAARGSTCAAIRGPPPVPVVNTPTAVTCPTPDGSGHRARPLSWGVLLALGAGHSTGWGLWRGRRQPVQAGGNGRAQGPTQRRYSCSDRYGSGQCHPSRRWLVEGGVCPVRSGLGGSWSQVVTTPQRVSAPVTMLVPRRRDRGVVRPLPARTRLRPDLAPAFVEVGGS